MEQFVINIGRQLGSGGRTVGEIIARRLGVKLYDKELINLAARESGICPEFFEKADEKESRSVLSTMIGYLRSPFAGDCGGVTSVLSNDALFKIQSDVIRDVAERESCIFVGRCADYILREHENCLNVFVHADKAARIKRIVGLGHCEEKKAPDFVTKKDKQRANYYNFYSNNRWDDLLNYDLTIDTSRFSVDMAVDLIIDAAKKLDV